jgi:copper chaperone CopZ
LIELLLKDYKKECVILAELIYPWWFMKTVSYSLTGMHCGACVGRVTKALEPLASKVTVTLTPPLATIEDARANFSELSAAVSSAGKYMLMPQDQDQAKAQPSSVPVPIDSWFSTYKPLLLILFMLTAVSLLVQLGMPASQGAVNGRGAAISGHEFMRFFMAGFFLVFGFFKLLDLNAFANAYQSYDLLAARWRAWGLIYPFIEIALGFAYLANFQPVLTHWLVIVVMGFSSIGVIRAVLSKSKIQCACLGTVFKLPMSTVTIVEDVGMVLMAAFMLISVAH